MCLSRREFIQQIAGAGVAVAGGAAVLATPEAAAAATAAKANVVLVNVRVFDGRAVSSPRTVAITNGVIGIAAFGAQRIDCRGAVLLPGLIDAHVHLEGIDTLRQLAGYGVTTAMDMACWPAALVDSLRRQPGLTDIRSAGVPATAPGSLQSHLPGYPESGVVAGPGQAQSFVTARLAEGSDYIKIIADIPGLDQATITAITTAAHARGKLVMAHATSGATVGEALQAGVDMIHHVPLDVALPASVARQYATKRTAAVPTLTTMEAFAGLGIPGLNYAAARDSVTALRQAGVQILAGTDANNKPGVPVHAAFGLSMHHELELLVQAGLSTVEALRAATVAPASAFGLYDRGAIWPGLRADLILVDGDPVADIRATRNIQRIWAGGIEHPAV